MMSNRGKTWTTEQEKKLLALHNDDKTIQIIANKLGRTQSAIRKRLNLLLRSKNNNKQTEEDQNTDYTPEYDSEEYPLETPRPRSMMQYKNKPLCRFAKKYDDEEIKIKQHIKKNKKRTNKTRCRKSKSIVNTNTKISMSEVEEEDLNNVSIATISASQPMASSNWRNHKKSQNKSYESDDSDSDIEVLADKSIKSQTINIKKRNKREEKESSDDEPLKKKPKFNNEDANFNWMDNGDILKWSADDLYVYLSENVCKSIKAFGSKFKEQNITGKTALRMKHEDWYFVGIKDMGQRLTIINAINKLNKM